MTWFSRSFFPLALLFALAPAALAQTVEITPFAGYRFGGSFTEQDDYYDNDLGIEVDDGESYGAIVDIALVRGKLFLELSASRQASTLITDEGLFSDDVELFDLDVDVYQVGLQFQWSPGQVRPFVGLGLGITRLRPDDPDFSDDDRFAMTFGGGVKIFFNQHIGFRFEGRGILTFIDTEDDVFCNDHGHCVRGDNDTYLSQGEVLAGLVLAF